MAFLESIDQWAGDAVALADDHCTISYGQLMHCAQQMARVLESQFGGRHCIIVRTSSTVQFVATMLGVMYSGNTPVPVDRGIASESLDSIQRITQAAAVIEPLDPQTYSDLQPGDYREPSIPALILFMPGANGQPHGSEISHENLGRLCCATSEQLHYRRYPSAAVAMPLYSRGGLISQVLCQLHIGGRVRLFRDMRKPVRFAKIVNQEGLETFWAAPEMYQVLRTAHQVTPLCMPTVRVVCSADGPPNGDWRGELKDIFPHARLLNAQEVAQPQSLARPSDGSLDESIVSELTDGDVIRDGWGRRIQR